MIHKQANGASFFLLNVTQCNVAESVQCSGQIGFLPVADITKGKAKCLKCHIAPTAKDNPFTLDDCEGSFINYLEATDCSLGSSPSLRTEAVEKGLKGVLDGDEFKVEKSSYL